MREDKLARTLFYVGCAGLPWLWLVHLLYWVEKQRRNASGENNDNNQQQSGLLHDESNESENTEDEIPLTASDIEEGAKRWVRLEFAGLVIVVGAWLAWIVVFQVLKDTFPAGWRVRSEDDYETTGW
mmetsp:Transcript_37793/g.43171  ORF Transcript_37793/g.43171 Transcript_37793/m.43171 type:complete len:127 (+) Transcript_37793:80-460(+)